jgi:MFS-type transporter involved in bile tolerance (Atg22 family)
MADVLEQVRICRCRIRRRRWLGLAVACATCALGWIAFGLSTAERSAASAGLVLSVVLLVGVAAGGVAAALVAGREPVFDSLAELRRALRQPVLGSVADAAGASPRSTLDLRFAIACVGLIALFAGLLVLQVLGLERQ